LLLLKNKQLSSIYAVLIVVYLLQTLAAPVDKLTLTKYHIDTTQARLLTLTIAIPYIIIWCVALIGYIRLNIYITLIQKYKDGAAFKTISKGILWLGLWLPVSTIINNCFFEYYSGHHAATANLVRLNNYLNLVILFGGFWLVYKGSGQLLALVKRKPTDVTSQAVTLLFITFSVLYTFLTLQDVARQHPTASVATATYYEPDWLILLTIVIPRLLYWFLGIYAVQNIYLYRKRIKGRLYKHALNNLALGLGAVVVVTVLLRCIQSLSATLERLSLGLLLGVVYILLMLISVGYVLIAKGAKSLQQLEEL
jgi:hypothetical protein